VSKSS